jgi:phosphate transport system permease protein
VGIIIAIFPIVSILWAVWSKGHRGLYPGVFFKDMHSTAYTEQNLATGGLFHAILGSALIVGFALLMSVPIGFLTAVYLTEIKGRFSRPIRFLVQSMSGVPSIVTGLFILAAIVYPITKAYSGFEGSLALAILMIPTIARTAEEVLILIPNDLRESGVALGGTQWKTVQKIVLPAARSGLVTALILGVARVAGETAPIVLLTGGGDTTSWNLFKGPMGTLPFYIWRGYSTGTDASIARAWTGLLVLLIVVFFLFGLARYLGGRKSK